MRRLAVTYESAPDADRLAEHVALCRRMPRASAFVHGPVERVLFGSQLAHYAEWTFPDGDALAEASRSDAFKTIAADAADMGIPHSVYVLSLSEDGT